MDSAIDAPTLRAYRETEYRVQGAGGFTLHIDRYSAPLAAAHAARRTDCSAFITACNPWSERNEPSDSPANRRRRAALTRELQRRALAFVEGVGQHPGNGWHGEASVLVFGLPLDEAQALARSFFQNAIVWNGDDAIPRLILLR